MRSKRPPVASLDEVKITRSGDAVIIEYADETISTTRLELGPEVEHLSDREILERWNECVEAREHLASEYEHVAVEVPLPRRRGDRSRPDWVSRRRSAHLCDA